MEQLSRPLINQLLAASQRAPEREVCALIGGRDGIAATLYPIDNVARDEGHRFTMEPRQQIEAMRQMRERGEQLYAIFHSHPDAPAVPSPIDIEQSAYPDALYLIVSLNTKGVLEMRGFRIRGGQVDEVELETVESPL